MDNQIFEDLRKSLDTTSTNGNSLLSPVLLSAIVSEQVRKQAVLANYIKHQPFSGQIYEWDSATSDGAAQSAVDGATLAWSDATFAQGISKQSYYYYLFAISGPAMKATETLIDVVEMRCRQSIKAISRLVGNALYAGDPVNAFNTGLNAALLASPTQSLVGSGATLNRGTLSAIDVGQRAMGYNTDVIIATPGAYAYLAEVSFNNVRFIGTDQAMQIGYSLSPSKGLMFNNIPVVMDPYAGQYTSNTAQAMTAVGGSSTQFTFSSPNAQKSAGSNFAGTSWSAPVVAVSGTTVPASAYSFSGNGVTFNSAPAATPTATYTSQSDALYFLSLAPEDLIFLESEEPNIINDLGKPATVDALYFRAQTYSALAVRNPLAHVLVNNITIPTLVTAF
jgi:hypothetical protein